MKFGSIFLAAVATIMLCAALGKAAPAEAQEGGEGGAYGYPAGAKPGPPPPDYEYANGKVFVGGDVETDCRSFIAGFDAGYDDWGNQEQAKRVLERCKRKGSSSLNPPPEVRAEVRADALAETGGLPLLPLAAGVLLLAGLGLFSLRNTT